MYTFKTSSRACRLLSLLALTSMLMLTGCQMVQPPVTSRQQQPSEVTSVPSAPPAMEGTNLSKPPQETPIYQEYSAEKFQALKGKRPVVLFFYAPWCPLCRAQEKNITANLNIFPSHTTILKTDYDTEKALRQTYGITIQTTFVILNSSGNVASTLHDPSLEALKSAITSSL